MALWVWLPGVGFESYRVRYRESRPIPEGTQRGTLADLVAAAETSVHWVSGHVASPMPHLRAESRVEEGRVVLLLVGRESVVEVLGARPDTAWFHRIDINEIDGSAVAVLITYVDGLE